MMRRWLEGWRLCRGLEPVIEYDDAYVAVLRLPGRECELFARTDDAATVARLAERVPEDTWLTVTTQAGERVAAQLLAAGASPFDEHKTLMSIELGRHPRPLNSTYTVTRSTEGPLSFVRLLAPDGTVAAHGMMAVVGPDAVMHDIQTDPAHRRRGLGSVVMGTLAARAIERGAETGLLMATT
ncbi:MAG: GNAT family N-acetyltransferase, partial [Kribbellaceae bacterium]|nr:GNAT family N-acetyltransferase [Kribbellaceae bacterium]